MEFDWSRKTDAEIVEAANDLAREFHSLNGYSVPEDYKFYEFQNTRAMKAWDMAKIAFEAIAGTDINDALANIEND